MLPAAFSLSRPTGVCFIPPKAPCPAPHLKITIYTDFVTYFAHANDLGLIYFVFFAPQAVFDYIFSFSAILFLYVTSLGTRRWCKIIGWQQ